MSYSDISPFSVVDYDKSHIVDLIRYKTGWDQRGEVYSKAQLNYIDQYLCNPNIKAATLVIEYDYVDRHYLEDYSEYYARCFQSHPRTCARVHFFSNKFDEDDFVDALRENNKEFIGELQISYIGFAVLRPIPKTCFAKLCLKPYSNDHDQGGQYKVITKKVVVSLFGIPLEIKSAPFLEQDKVVSACATSAIWTFLSASKDRSNEANPSPSAITKSAFDSATDGVRTFPNAGLSVPQVCRSLKSFGFEPALFYKNEGKGAVKTFLEELKEYVFAYVSADVPLIVGGVVYDCSIPGVPPRLLGPHLVCVLGYKVSKSDLVDPVYAHGIDKLYVHDDRYGPYVRLEDMAQLRKEKDDTAGFRSWLKSVIAKIRSGETPAPRDGFQLAILNKSEIVKREIFVPDVAIVGLYHKVRISYPVVFNMHRVLLAYIESPLLSIESIYSDMNEKMKAYLDKIVAYSRGYISGAIKIELVTNSCYKSKILDSERFFSFNGIRDNAFLLTASLPRYIWRCRVLVGKELHSDILIDATEILQGNVILGVVSFCEEAEFLWKSIEKSNVDHEWDGLGSEEDRELIGGYIRFFQRGAGESKLNSIYGPLRLPKRKLKDGEFDSLHNITRRSDIVIIVGAEKSPFWQTMDCRKKYIWVINGDGHLVVGEDVELVTDDATNRIFRGHPTLTNGMPARLGGEFVNVSGQWFINLRSRSYPSGCKPQDKRWHAILERIINSNINGLVVQKELPEDAVH